jgi:carbamoyl-phosphate synthase large subunit
VTRAARALGVHPVYKRIDTCAAEFASPTAYMYSTYETPFAGARGRGAPSDRKKVIILGGGPNRIGQGIEFDYCCCHACLRAADAGYETIMVNCNPETVSTDYDTSDRLYFEPLTAEDVLEIVGPSANGTLHGVIVQFGGQTPLKLADALERPACRSSAPRPTPSTSPRTATASSAARALGSSSRKNGIAYSLRAGPQIAETIGFPVVVIRPSYVLGGRAMEIVTTRRVRPRHAAGAGAPASSRYPNDKTGQINSVSGKSPLLIDRYLSDAIEVDVDALATARTCSSAASWSTSRRPASIPATAPARCRRIR